MSVRLSTNIDAPDCQTCGSRRPWADTIRALEERLRSHAVEWQDFLVVHARDKRCSEASTNRGLMNAALYLMAVDASGREAGRARVFYRQARHIAMLGGVLDGSAFELERLINRCGRP